MATTEERLNLLLQDIAKKENYESSKIDVNPINSGGANFTTDLYLATISEPHKQVINLFAKTGNMPKEARKNNEYFAKVYEIEAIYYTELAVCFENLYSKHQVPEEDRLLMSKCYGHVVVPYEEILVLENMEAKGFKNVDRMKSMNWEYAAAAVTQLAKFHALGIALRKENPEEFERIVSNFHMELEATKGPEMTGAFLEIALQHGCGGLNGEEKRRLLKFFSAEENQPTQILSKMLTDKTMLIHADFKPTNLMHRRRNGKLEIILLDYQVLRLGNPMVDLMYFVFCGSDDQFRKLHYQNLMEHYFKQLALALQQLGVDVEEVYPRSQFDADLIQLRYYGLFFGLVMAAGVTVSAEDAPDANSKEGYSNIQVKPNQLAQQRISGIVRDFIRWGVL